MCRNTYDIQLDIPKLFPKRNGILFEEIFIWKRRNRKVFFISFCLYILCFIRYESYHYPRGFIENLLQQDDLWYELGIASSLPVKDVMKNWTLKKGFPIIFAEIISWEKYMLRLKLTQDYIEKLYQNIL